MHIRGVIKVNKLEKEAAKIRAEKKADFIKRYSEAFSITDYWTFSLFDTCEESKSTVKMRVMVVEYLLKNTDKEIKMQDILFQLGQTFRYHLGIMIDGRSPLSPVGAGVIKNKPGFGYFITDKEKAELWLKFMNELIKRNW